METRLIKIHKAQGSGEETQSLQIDACEEADTDKMTLNEARDRWIKEGKYLGDALFDHLPGGLIDGLLAAMLQRRASLFVVKF